MDHIPMARSFYTSDINDAVIKVQELTGVTITPEWWKEHVGNEGSAEDILTRFDQAYAHEVEKRGAQGSK